ncbi:hypothetical protein MPTK1_8g01860 [Marchantia polymorpha subsp. ruderalis]|uniref:Mediator complex subunit 15 KIX domain-containing protein n=1 Tax=Marchantia polymorpha TaxID=3197 RepID=A0A2R6WR38_MARPO|nr:hypothetical protein MARPO_0064s0014 [Marchantia polymorpha]BBN18352.1 hypothetical protein Mp_8g01860 [Marchantia polymorpha subsp. ruderalis]|eukprot:PTQ36321.1 hypothetical protein MARPO_0064s0014 [Marchantia polymorpha]
MDSSNWRNFLPHDYRQKIIKRIMDNLQRHLPPIGQESMGELLKIAWRFEEKIYQAATDQQDYLRRISLKMLSLEAWVLRKSLKPGKRIVMTLPVLFLD